MPFWKRYLDRLIRWITFYSKNEWICRIHCGGDWADRSWVNTVFAFIVFVIGIAIWRQYLERPAPRI